MSTVFIKILIYIVRTKMCSFDEYFGVVVCRLLAGSVLVVSSILLSYCWSSQCVLYLQKRQPRYINDIVLGWYR